MNDKFQFIPRPILPPASGSPARPATRARAEGPAFDQVLQQELNRPSGLQFSRHALQRMESRGIQFSGDEMTRLENAVQAVSAKGGRDSLVLLGEKALVVSARNSTVVTVVDRDNLQGNVFTNIDSAVIA